MTKLWHFQVFRYVVKRRAYKYEIKQIKHGQVAQSEECLSCTFVVTGSIPGEASVLFILIQISKNAEN